MLQHLEQLRQTAVNLPPEYRAALLSRVDLMEEQHNRRQRIFRLLQEAIEQLRLDTKYLMFDLECTRRERDDARANI